MRACGSRVLARGSLALALALALLPVLAFAEDTVAVRLVDVTLGEAIGQLADLIGECFLLPALARERITLDATRVELVADLPRAELLPRCAKLLATHGFDLIEVGDAHLPIHRVVPSTQVAAYAARTRPVRVAPLGQPGESAISVLLSLEGVELKALPDLLAGFSDDTIVYRQADLRATGVCFHAPAPVARNHLLTLLQAILEEQDLGLVAVGEGSSRVLKIVPLEDFADRELHLADRRAVAFAGGETLRADFAVTRAVGEHEWRVSAADALDVTRNLEQYLDEVSLRAYYDPRSRTQVGIQIRTRVALPRFAKFGLRNRDVVMSVGGEPVTRAEQIAELVERFRASPSVRVRLLRNGKDMELLYHLPGRGSAGRVDLSAPSNLEALVMTLREHLGIEFAWDDGLLPAAASLPVHLLSPRPLSLDSARLALQCVLEVNGLTLAPMDAAAATAGYLIARLPWCDNLIPDGE